MPEGPGYLMPEPSWDLRIIIPNLQVEKTLRVKGDMHIGGIMLKLVEEMDINAIDWSDHGLWWPKKNCWLIKTRQTLNHYGVQADSYLIFTPMHKPLRVQLPDLRYIDANVDFSVDCFTAVKLLCKELGIRHSEELSFCRPLSAEHLKKNYQNVCVTPKQRTIRQGAGGINNGMSTYNYKSMRRGSNDTFSSRMSLYIPESQIGTIDTRNHSPDITSTLSRHASYRGFTTTYSTTMSVKDLNNLEISFSPNIPLSDSKNSLLYPKNLIEKARLNAGWLNSDLSLYQQNVRDYDLLQLRFKYSEFYDLNPKLDMARINQIYEQAKWSLLTGEIGCTKEEMNLFSSLQYQIQQQANDSIPYDIENTNDDIDAALTELQLELESKVTTVYDRTSYNAKSYNQTISRNLMKLYKENQSLDFSDDMKILGTLELSDSIRFMRLRKFTFKTFKRLFFVFFDKTLTAYRKKDDRMCDKAAFVIDLPSCHITPDVNVSHAKYGVKLSIPDVNSMTQYLLRFDTEIQYAKWMAAFKLASKGKQLTDISYEEEVSTILELFNLQYSKLHKSDEAFGRSAVTKILEENKFKYLSPIECKLNYIKAWRALTDYGIHMFLVKFDQNDREEILGIASDRLIRINPINGHHLRVWPYAKIKTWQVNWDNGQVLVECEDGVVLFTCLSANCRIAHEFIGGYIFLSMRSKNSCQITNEKLFYSLTKDWND